MKEQVKLTTSMILEDLEQGLNRKGIGEKYNLSGADVKRLFEHKDLKGKKTKTKPGFIIVSEDELIESEIKVEEGKDEQQEEVDFSS